MISQIVKRHFQSHKSLRHFSHPVALQIEAVNSPDIPKNAFLFDYGAADVKVLKDLIHELRKESLISRDVKLAKLEWEIFIVNVKKINFKAYLNIVDVGSNLEKPQLIDEKLEINSVIKEVIEQLKNSQEDFVELGSYGSYCPTLFGILINYPVLYFCNTEENCLGNQELKVFQILADSHVLLSFSVPLKIYNRSPKIQKDIQEFIERFKSYSIKTFNTYQCNVIL